MVDFTHIPAELCGLDQWLVWKYEEREGKRTKVPYTVDGRRAATTRSEDWTEFGVVREVFDSGRWDGIGFVFTADDPFCGIDLDHACAANGRIEDWALTIITLLNSYTEWTPSGAGFHIIVEGTLPSRGRRHGNVEIYQQARFFTVTGARCILTTGAIRPRQDALDHLLGTFPTREPSMTSAVARPPAFYPMVFVEQMRRAKNGPKFERLYDHGDISGYQSWSEAELALCEMIAWYDPSPSTVDTVFRQSALMRDRWDEPRGDTTRGGLTIAAALSMVTPRSREAWSVPLYKL